MKKIAILLCLLLVFQCVAFAASDIENTNAIALSISASETSITTDGGQVTITPAVTTDLTDAVKTVSYKTDNNNALAEKKSDGSLVLTGKMNGNITVTAISDFDNSVTDKVTISISGQTEKQAYYGMNMFMIGNSILKHTPNPAIGWNNDCGMAASSAEKDYAHRLQYYLSEKYGEVDFSTYAIASFERKITNDVTKDYSEDLKPVRNAILALSSLPEIVTIQMGENATGCTDPAAYENAIAQLVGAIREVAPKAQVIGCTSFFPYAEKTEGMHNAAKKMNFRYVNLHELNVKENKASEYEHGGVAAHPNDRGMDEIGKYIFEQLTVSLTENVQPQYVIAPASIKIVADKNVIDEADGTLQLRIKAEPEGATDLVEWSVDNMNFAVVDDNGVVTAKNNGTVKVTAVSKYDSKFTDTYTIAISGQTNPYTLTYEGGTDDSSVTNLPEKNTYAKGEFKLSGQIPERAYYIFKGWATAPNSENVVDTVNVTSDMSVYAVWRAADYWSFDRDGYFEGVTVDNGFNVYVNDGSLQALATETDSSTGNVLKIVSPKLNIDAKTVANFVVKAQSSAKSDSTKFKIVFKTTDGDVALEKQVTSTDVSYYVYDVSSLTGTITGFEIMPTDVDCAVTIDEMGFNIKYDKYTDSVNGLRYRLITNDGIESAEIVGVSKVIYDELVIADEVTFDDGNTYPVTSIATYAMSSAAKSNLTVDGIANSVVQFTSITLPDTITRIGSSAFAFDGKLVTFNMGNGVKVIDSYNTFYECKALKNVTLSPSLTNTPVGMFQFCTSLESIKIPGSVTGLSSKVFNGCTALKKVEFEGAATTIAEDAFAADKTVRKDIEIWGISATDSAYSLSKAHDFAVKKGLKFIATNFKYTLKDDGTYKIVGVADNTKFGGTVLIFPSEYEGKSVTEIDKSTSLAYLAVIEEIIIPDSYTTLPDSQYANTFYQSKRIKKVTLSKNLQGTIGSVFNECTSIESIEIPDGVTALNRTFIGCTGLKEVKLGKNSKLESISSAETFKNCTALEKLYVPSGLKTIASGLTVPESDNFAFVGYGDYDGYDGNVKTWMNGDNKYIKDSGMPYAIYNKKVGTTVTANIKKMNDIKNGDIDITKAIVICAVYDGNNSIVDGAWSRLYEGGTLKTSHTFNDIDYSEGCTVKIFVWYGMFPLATSR